MKCSIRGRAGEEDTATVKAGKRQFYALVKVRFEPGWASRTSGNPRARGSVHSFASLFRASTPHSWERLGTEQDRGPLSGAWAQNLAHVLSLSIVWSKNLMHLGNRSQAKICYLQGRGKSKGHLLMENKHLLSPAGGSKGSPVAPSASRPLRKSSSSQLSGEARKFSWPRPQAGECGCPGSSM